MHPRVKNLTGTRFGWLIVIAITPKRTKGNNVIWKCKCDCGKLTYANSSILRSGGKRSCGCRQQIRHGRTGDPVWRTWKSMVDRCSIPSSGGYSYYGGRGIKVCKRWQTFENFLADVGERPKGKSVDRIDNDGDYKPTNFRWATPQEQANNRRARRWRRKPAVL